MRTITTKKGNTIELYDGIDEMTIERYHKFNQMIVLSSGIGGDTESIMQKVNLIRKHIADNQPKKADVELLNLNQSLYFAVNSIDPKSVAFACLVHSIDGEEQTLLTEDAIHKLSQRLNAILLKSEMDNALERIKKKLKAIWRYTTLKRNRKTKK